MSTILLASCSSPPAAPTEQPTQPPDPVGPTEAPDIVEPTATDELVDADIDPFDLELLPVVLADETRPLETETTDKITAISEDTAVLTFEGVTEEELEALQPGNIIASGSTAGVPDGFLRRVVEVQEESGSVSVVTEEVALAEAVVSGTLIYEQTLTPDMVESASLSPGIRLRPSTVAPAQAPLVFEFEDVPIARTAAGSAYAHGLFSIEPTLSMRIDIRDGGIVAVAEAEVTQETELWLTADFESPDLEIEYTVGEFRGNPVTIYVAGIPIVLRPKIALVVGLEGSVEAEAETGVETSLTFSVGGRVVARPFEVPEFTPVTDFDTNFIYHPPEVTTALNAKMFAGISFTLELYGKVNLSVVPNAYIKRRVEGSHVDYYYGVGINFSLGLESLIRDEVAVRISETLVEWGEVFDSYDLADAAVSAEQPTVMMYEGPGTVYDAVGSVNSGEEVGTLSVNPARTWVKIELFDATRGWIPASQLEFIGANLDDLPIADDIPAPPVTPTPYPTSVPPTEVPPAGPPVATQSLHIPSDCWSNTGVTAGSVVELEHTYVCGVDNPSATITVDGVPLSVFVFPDPYEPGCMNASAYWTATSGPHDFTSAWNGDYGYGGYSCSYNVP